MDIGRELNKLDQRLTRVERSPRLTHASLEDTALQVYDGSGSLRGILGQQGDGTTAVNVVNGPPPPQPSAPIVASVLGGVTVSWDGTFAGGATLPLDWSRVEVHAAITAVYEPVPATLQGTIETAQGATLVVPCDTPVYVRLVARTTSGTASTASDTVGPFGPVPVVADDILDGVVTTVKLADDAVTQAKVAVGAITTDALAFGIGNLAPDPSFEGDYTAQVIAGHADWTQVTPGNNSPHALHVDCTSGFTTWKNIELARYPVLPGERHYLAVDFKTSAAFNGTGVKLMFRYEDLTGTVLGYGVADKPFAPGDGWARATAQAQAPTGTATAVLLVEASEVTAGEAWFDNAEVSTLIVGGKVAAGSVTATEIAALTIQAANIAADAIAAGKIAADAVTAREIDALAVTAAEIAANAITAGKIQAGAVDATALAADAITGKTITGGTITGALLQTATSGQRITLNESSANKILVYDSTGRAVAELSALGLGLIGSAGAKIVIDPNATFPNLIFTNSDQTKSAAINVSGTDARLGLNSGQFTGSGYTDMKWRTFFGNDFAVIERVRDSNTSTVIGGRVFLTNDHATLAMYNTDDATQSNGLYVYGSYVQISNGRLDVTTPASSNPALSVNAASGHTGALHRLQVAGVDKFSVDKDGNLTVAGIGQRVTKRRTTDATKTTTTLGTDGFLTFPVDANATYVLDGLLVYSGPGDFEMGWIYPSGTTGTWQGLGNGITVVSGTASNGTQQDTVSTWGYTVRTETTDLSNPRTFGGITTTPFGVHVKGIIRVGGTAGTFALQWAQGSSNATGTVLYTDSHLRLEKVS